MANLQRFGNISDDLVRLRKIRQDLALRGMFPRAVAQFCQESRNRRNDAKCRQIFPGFTEYRYAAPVTCICCEVLRNIPNSGQIPTKGTRCSAIFPDFVESYLPNPETLAPGKALHMLNLVNSVESRPVSPIIDQLREIALGITKSYHVMSSVSFIGKTLQILPKYI